MAKPTGHVALEQGALVNRGDAAAGIPCFERAIRLSPLDPFSFNCFIGLGLATFAVQNQFAGETLERLQLAMGLVAILFVRETYCRYAD